MLPNSNCKLPNIEVTELAVWPCDNTKLKSICVLQAYSMPPQKWKSMSHISDPMPKKKTEVCSKTWKKAKVWRLAKSMWNRALTWMHPTCADRWEKTWPIKVGSPLNDYPSTLMSFCKFSNYTEWWWCVKVKTVHSMMSRNVPKVAHSCFSRTELNAPLPPLMAHVATPDGTHQESMCNWRQTNLPANWWDPGG